MFQLSCNFNLPGHIHLGLRPETAGQKLSWFISFSHAPDSSCVLRQTTCLLLPCPLSLCLGPRCSIKGAPELGFCLDTEAGPCQICGVKSALSDEMEEGPSRVSTKSNQVTDWASERSSTFCILFLETVFHYITQTILELTSPGWLQLHDLPVSVHQVLRLKARVTTTTAS